MTRDEEGQLSCTCKHWQYIGSQNGVQCWHIQKAIERGIMKQ